MFVFSSNAGKYGLTKLRIRTLFTKRRKKSFWVNLWLVNPRRTSGFGNIYAELWLKDDEEFMKYLRMNTETHQVPILYFINFKCYSWTCHILKKKLA